MSEVTKCKHGRNFCLECHQAGSELDTALSQLAALRSANESLSAELAWSENDSRDQSKEIAALREELATYKLANTNLIESCSEKFDLLTINEQRLADAERRNSELVELLKSSSELFWAIEGDLGAISASAVGVTRIKIDTYLNKPEEAKS